MHSSLLVPYQGNVSGLASVTATEDAFYDKFASPDGSVVQRLLDRYAPILIQAKVAAQAEIDAHPYTAIWLGKALNLEGPIVIVSGDQLYRLSRRALADRIPIFPLFASAVSGYFHVCPSGCFQDSPEARSDGRPLYFERQMLWTFRTPPAQLTRIANSVIADTVKAGKMLTREQFAQVILKKAPFATAAEIDLSP